MVLSAPPIDEVVVGIVLDKPLGLDAVEAGMYLLTRQDRFTKHEIHEPIGQGTFSFPGPVRVWLVSTDDAWLVQLQEDRFVANWRRRDEALYPGFTRDGGAMHFVLQEFERFRAFCKHIHGEAPNPMSVEMSKIDLLVEGKHWTGNNAADLMPALSTGAAVMSSPGPTIALRWEETVTEMIVNSSISPARLKADPKTRAFRLEFRAAQPASDDLAKQLTAMNVVLNDAFHRVIPGAEGWFK